MIYVLEQQNRRWIKIGFVEKDVKQRIAALQTGNPYKLNLVFIVEGTLLQEQSIHNSLTSKFGLLHIPIPPNEWYPGKTPFMYDFLEELKISVSGAISLADSLYDGRSKIKWMGGMRELPREDRHNGDPILKWPLSKRSQD